MNENGNYTGFECEGRGSGTVSPETVSPSGRVSGRDLFEWTFRVQRVKSASRAGSTGGRGSSAAAPRGPDAGPGRREIPLGFPEKRRKKHVSVSCCRRTSRRRRRV